MISLQAKLEDKQCSGKIPDLHWIPQSIAGGQVCVGELPAVLCYLFRYLHVPTGVVVNKMNNKRVIQSENKKVTYMSLQSSQEDEQCSGKPRNLAWPLASHGSGPEA